MLRKIGCRCVLDENKDVVYQKPVELQCANRFKQLSIGVESEEPSDTVSVDVDVVGGRVKEVNGFKKERKLRIATWNFSGLCSERKQKEVGELLKKLNLDIVAGQESWEKEGKVIAVDGYTWFGKPCSNQKSQRGEGGVGFLVREYLVNEVEFISNTRYEESVWMKVRGGRGREALYICCVYMPTDSTSVSVIDNSYEKLKEDVLSFKQKGRVVLLGDFNARVGRAVDVNDVICNGRG